MVDTATEIARVLASVGQAPAALERVDHAVAIADAAGADHTDALMCRIPLLIKLDRAVEAEAQARQLAESAGPDQWEAETLVVRSLRAQGRDQEADEYRTAHDLDDEDE